MGRLESEALFLARIAGNGTVAVDIGANMGTYTYPMQRVFEHVVAFEPIQHLADELMHLGPNAQVYNVALSDRKGTAILKTPVRRSQNSVGVSTNVEMYGWSTLELSPIDIEHAAWQATEVDVTTLDAYDLDDVALIKIDVEGHELQVLEGARTTLQQNRPTVLVEVQAANQDDVSSFFEQLDYEQRDAKELLGVPGTAANRIFTPRNLSDH
jgi:FkbM family methyltransferase